MDKITADPERLALANELHARPFPELKAPCRAVFLAVRPEGGDRRDKAADHARLVDLITRQGGTHPAPDAAHHATPFGRGELRWEAHTEIVTYTLFVPDVAGEPFSGEAQALFPSDWLANLGGPVVAAALVRVEMSADHAAAEARFVNGLQTHFAAESLAACWVGEREALVFSDFRIHEGGFARIGVIADATTGPRRLGRIVQRLIEIECYKSLALTALPVARTVGNHVRKMEKTLSDLLAAEAEKGGDARASLVALTRLSAEIEQLSVETDFRFGARGAYEAIVNDRIESLREGRLGGRILYSEFMKRRFDPAMRTCRAAEQRLAGMSARVARASSLLSTRVNVAAEVQNQKLLESMDQRAALQLRLQQTVEGLSVVAISYYALNLAAYLTAPLAKMFLGVDKTTTFGVLALPVALSVWWIVRQMRKRWEK